MTRASLPVAVTLVLLSAPAVAVEPDPQPKPAAPVQTPATLAVEPDPPVPQYTRRLGLSGVVGIGHAPRAAVGVAADVAMWWAVTSPGPMDGVSLSVGVRWDPAAAAAVPGIMGAQVSTSRFLAELAPCVSWWVMRYCALAAAGRMWGSVDYEAATVHRVDVKVPDMIATGGRIGVEIPFARRVGLRVYADVLGTWTPVSIVIEDHITWTASRVVGGVGAGLYIFN